MSLKSITVWWCSKVVEAAEAGVTLGSTASTMPRGNAFLFRIAAYHPKMKKDMYALIVTRQIQHMIVKCILRISCVRGILECIRLCGVGCKLRQAYCPELMTICISCSCVKVQPPLTSPLASTSDFYRIRSYAVDLHFQLC